jgi:hypothetical protein
VSVERDLGAAARVAAADVTPAPSDEEAAAIVSAVEAMWPRAAAPPQPERRAVWRFSGRWWARPLPSRRDRPFR